jgi:hypothetical protein
MRLATRLSECIMARNGLFLVGSGLALALAAVASQSAADDLNDYPTSARAEYVFGCMKANGETPRTLEQCSCSIDIMATLLPYDRYVSAETVLRMAQVPGVLGSQFRSTEQAKSAVDDLRRAQAEAEVRCF